MPWINLKAHDPAASLAVYKDGVLVAPIDYAAEGVAIAWVGDAIELTYPPGELNAYTAMAVASAPPLNFLARHIAIAHDPWVGLNDGSIDYLTPLNVLTVDSNLDDATVLQQYNNLGDGGDSYNGIGITTPVGGG